MSKSRANRVRTAISAIYSLAVKWKYASHNPIQSVDKYKEDLHKVEYWSEEEAHKFLSWAFKTKNPRFSFYQTAYETGMRVSELIALQRD